MLSWSSLVFALALATDWLYVKWAQASTSHRPGQAFITAGLIQVAGASSTVLYVANPYLLPFNVAGHAVGSYLAVKYSNKKGGVLQ